MKIFLGTVTFLALFQMGLAYPRDILDPRRDTVVSPEVVRPAGAIEGGTSSCSKNTWGQPCTSGGECCSGVCSRQACTRS
ncbi:hypothetical protein PTTW11_09632 [Pyrenophora teres f. teres]|uniref:Uncharacterized protein n=1 Tax=Pyrenophora teres f. teres TaxID=97479 RepID=A0A6S6WBF6_9PLEO|nr:hypothetical protein PTTW11_09632 [Pyrenophora teres f. teres]